MHCIGSYDCTAKIWCRRSWDLLHTLTVHVDSVWDLRIHYDILATAGLDGTVGVFKINQEPDEQLVDVKFLIHVSQLYTDKLSSQKFIQLKFQRLIKTWLPLSTLIWTYL